VSHIVTHVAALATLFAALVGTGAAIEYFVEPDSSADHWAGFTRIVLGLGAWLTLLFACAALGFLRRTPLVIADVAAAAFALVVAWRERNTLIAAARNTIPSLPTTVGFITFAAVAIVLAALFFVSLTPFVGWDDSVAHLTLPRIYLEHGGFRRVPFNVYSNWPLNTELLYALAMLMHDYIVAKLVHLAFLALTLLATYRLASTYASPLSGGFAAMLLLGNDVVLDEARSAYIDLAYAFFLLMAFVYACQYLEERRKWPLLLSGICCGLVAGTKLTGGLAAPYIVIVVIVSHLARNRWIDPRGVVRDVVLFVVLPAALLALPWYVRTYVYTGNPVYPLLYDKFGGPDWNSDLSRQFFDWQKSIGMGRGVVDYLLLPARVALQGSDDYAHFAGRINPLWAVLVPFSFVAIRSSPLVRRSLGLAAMYFAVWALSSQQARFLIPVLPFLAVAAGIAAANAFGSLVPPRAVAAPVVIVIAGLALLWTTRDVIRQGVTAGHDILAHGVDVPSDAQNDMERFISERLPARARLLLLNTNQGFLIDREYIADSFFEASQINALLLQGGGSALGISRRLRSAGLTHVLFARRNWGIVYPPGLAQFLGDRSLAQQVYRSHDGEYTLFEIRSALASAPTE